MQQDKPRILIISSCSLSQGPAAIAGQYYDALKQAGVEVDLLLKLPEPGRPDIMYVWDEIRKTPIHLRALRKIQMLFHRQQNPKPGFFFFYKRENHPPVPTRDILDKIKKPYDLVYVVFWQTMLSFESIDKIYDKLHCQFQFAGVDYSQMSGGCHFTNGCERYKLGCGCCPAFCSKDENDFTAWNVRYRKRVYEKIRPVVYANQYTLQFYRRSYLLKNARCEINASAIIDTDVFRPLDIFPLRKKYDIPDTTKYIIFFASQNLNDDRKGIKYLIEALNFLYNKYINMADDVLVMMAGRDFEKVSSLIPFRTKGVGYVPMNRLPELFSMATLFVCPSVNDAGPMMVGQSLCCATPVVGFDMGSVKELVKDKGTGVCVPLKDSQALADGMETVIRMSEEEYDKMSIRCRDIALNYCSYGAQANLILRTYNKYKRNTSE